MNPNKTSCCEKPAFCRCIEHGGTCRNCGKKREEVTYSLPQEKELSAVAFVETGEPGLPLVKIDGELLTVKEDELQKYRQALLSQARREYMTSLAEKVREAANIKTNLIDIEEGKVPALYLDTVLALIEKDLEK